MRKIIALSVVTMFAATIGCENKNKMATSGDLMPPPEPMHSTPVMPGPVTTVSPGGQPMDVVTPVSYQAAPLPAMDANDPAPGQTYTVRKGDTLWNIAARAYGDGKQYRRITAANSSIRNETVMIGQRILVP